MLAEALQTTVLDEVKENVTVLETPKILEEEEKFEEMSKQPLVEEDDDEDDDTKFQEMTSVEPKHESSTAVIKEDLDEDDDEEPEEEVFKIKEEVDEEEESTEMNVPPTATSPPLTKSMDLLGNDIVKSIEHANMLYEGDLKNDLNSSEDDLEFKPVTSGKKKRKNRKNSNNHSEASSFADSESSEAMIDAMENKNEGWSFEADSNDIFKLLNMSQQPQGTTETESSVKQEKAALEDVFKFDSELMTSDQDNVNSNVVKPENVVTSKMSTSLLNYEEPEEKEEENKNNGLSQSLTSWATTTSTSASESEVGNSPNPRATSKKKGKKKKKR